jgi:hypothetical protein
MLSLPYDLAASRYRRYAHPVDAGQSPGVCLRSMPSWTAHHAGTAKHGQISTGGEAVPGHSLWSFRHTSHGMTGPYQLDGASDLTSEDDTLRDGMDGWVDF